LRLTTRGRKSNWPVTRSGLRTIRTVWLDNLADANATPAAHAHLDPQVRLAKQEPMGNREARDSLVNPGLREAQGNRRMLRPSIAAIAHKVDPELLDPRDLPDLLDQTETLATLVRPEDRLEPEAPDPKDLQETLDQPEMPDLRDLLEIQVNLEAKERLVKEDNQDRQDNLDRPDSPDSQPAEAAKDLLDLQGRPANLDPLENLGPKAPLEVGQRLETMPSTARARRVAEGPRLRRADGLLPEVVDVSLLSLSYRVISFSVVAML